MGPLGAALTCVGLFLVDRAACTTPQLVHLLVGLHYSIARVAVLRLVGLLLVEGHFLDLELHPDLGNHPGDAVGGDAGHGGGVGWAL